MFGLRLLASQHYIGDYLELYGLDDSGAVRRYVTAELTSQPLPDGVEIAPMLKISRTSAQELMDSLWQCGLRPSEGSGSAGALVATQKHLEDMRRLVFDK